MAFDLDEKVERVFVRSRAERPCDSIGPYVDYRRRLGVLIDSIMAQDISTNHRSEIDFQDRFLRGRHTPEVAPMRWTKGAAEVILPNGLSTAKKRLSLRVLHNETYRV